MRVKLGIAVVGFSLLCSAAPVTAHHSFSSEYAEDKVVTLKGKVTRVDWTNPHARFFVDAVDDNNNVTSWAFELASPNSLTRSGWGRRTLSVGDEVTVSGYAAISGKPMASTTAVTLSDGRKLFSGTQTVR